jgi:cytochrome c-type biogenesis protein CcmF
MALSHLGFFLLFMCCLLSVYGSIAGLLSAQWQHRRLYQSAKVAQTAAAALSVSAAIMLWVLLFQRDFSVAYVYKNSSLDLPWRYTFTAFWSSLEGSHFLWTLFLTICSTIAIWTHSRTNEHVMPYVAASMLAVQGWMYYLLISYSDPFLLQLPAQADGQGMNALLQNPYMVIHPPLLFVGYTTLVVPFAYAIAALGYGDITEGWVRTVRRWTLVSFAFLTAAITLGGRWAYVELGWAGYWAWDPVENASLMPWLVCTALLHSLIVQEKLGHLKRLSIVLSISAFFLTFLGTFITRSGVITSVHSFAESSIGPNYLAFLSVMLLSTSALYAWRANRILPPETDKIWGVSKESALVVTQFILLSFTAIVLIGTLFPIFSEAITNHKISIQAPYFNAFAPYIGAATMVAIGIGNLMFFRSGKISGGRPMMIGSLVVALPMTAAFAWAGKVYLTTAPFAMGAQLVGLYLAAWCLACLTYDFFLRLKRFKAGFTSFFRFNRGYVGAYAAHVGMVVVIVGFLGNYRGIETEKTFNSGDRINVYGYELLFGERVQVSKVENATLFTAPVVLSRDGRQIAVLKPAQAKYPTASERMNEIGVFSTLWHDVYVVLSSFRQSDGRQVTLSIHINPTVRFVWIGVMLMVLGGLVSATDRRRGMRSNDVTGSLAREYT